MEIISQDINQSPFVKEKHLFTVTDIYRLLQMIDELDSYEIMLRKRYDGALHIHIGDSVYNIWDEVEL